VATPVRVILHLLVVIGLLVSEVSASVLTALRPGTEPSDLPPPLFAFAQALFDSGEYFRAIGEFQRFLFFAPDHQQAPSAQLMIGLAFFCGERWLPAFEVFRRVTRTAADPVMREEAALWMAEARARGSDHAEATRLFAELTRRSSEPKIADRAAYLIGWSRLWQRQWPEAHADFTVVPPHSPYAASAGRLAAALDPPPQLPRRSPTVARVLATVLPGAGQIYAGNIVDGLIGLGLHAALIAGTTGAIWAGLEGAAGIGAFFTWGFYQTQRANAPTNAEEFNARAEARFIGQLAAHEGAFLKAFLRPLPCTPSISSPSLGP
jgi:TM2 domain-containing membrane protein YozV